MSSKAVLLAGVVIVIIGVAGIVYRTPHSPPPIEIQNEPNEPLVDFGDVSLRVELATTTEARQRGLGGRTALPSNYGMLFVFEEDGLYGFWMKDTLVPLDIFWLDAKGQVIHIESNVATSSYPRVFYPPVPARYVLETAAGFTEAHGVTLETVLGLQKLPLVSK